MKLKNVLWIALVLYGIQWLRHNLAYFIFLKLNKDDLLNVMIDIHNMNIVGSLYMIIIVICVGFLILIDKKDAKGGNQE